MATRLKTVEYAMPVLASLTDNTLTALTSITISLPEAPSGSAFKSVIAVVSAMQTATAAGNVTTRRIDFSVGGATAGTHTNSNLYTGSGEDIFVFHAADMTSHFVANWTTGTSKSFAASVLMDGTATAAAYTNVNVTIFITYEYDDTSATQIKTVRIPLNCGVAALGTTKPGTANDTIPNLSTELPEASKVYRSTYITLQGMRSGTVTTDSTITMQLDTTTAITSGTFEGGQITNYFMRYVWDVSAVLNTASTMGFFAWSSVANMWFHMQAWLTVTYEFDATSSNATFVSLFLPMEVDSPMGDSSTTWNRASRDVWIQEPSTITTKQLAFYSFWEQTDAIAGLNQRIGTGAFSAITSDTSAQTAGSNCAMVKTNDAFTLAAGRNSINWDIYRTDTADLGFGVSGFWIVNYTAGKPTGGYGAANHTVFFNLGAFFDGAASTQDILTAIAPSIPETNYFLTSIGTEFKYISNTTTSPSGISVQTEKTTGEGGFEWKSIYVDTNSTDPETGMHSTYATARDVFKRWVGDDYSDRLDLETSRRWRTSIAAATTAGAAFHYLNLVFTYHTITKTVSGNITGSSGGTVTISVHRETTGEKILETSRTGDGSYSLTWYDGTETLYAEAYESSTKLGRSDNGVAV